MKKYLLILIILNISCAPKAIKQPLYKGDAEYCNQPIAAPIKIIDVENQNVFDTGNNSELFNCINANYPERTYKVAYSVKLINVKKGRILDFNVYGEVTNDYQDSRTMVAWYTVLSDTNNNIEGIELSERRGYNIDYERHHDVFNDGGVYQFTEDFNEIYLNFVLYTINIDGFDLKNGVRLEKDYGRLYGSVK